MNEKAIDLRTFGGRLRFARIKRGMSQQELAGLVGTYQSYISILEFRHFPPKKSTELIKKIAKTLGISAEWLMYGSGGDYGIEER